MDISSAGCLLESNCRLEKGATGLLRVRFEDAEYMDDVRVMRCQESEGGSGFTSSAPSSCGRPARTSVRCDASFRSCRGRRCGASRSNDRCKFEVFRRVCRRGLSGRAHSRPAKTIRDCARRIGSSRCQAPILASQERSAALGYDTRSLVRPHSLAVGWSHRAAFNSTRLVERRTP